MGTAHDPVRVVVAGGGVGALEALIALRGLARARLDITLVAPGAEFVYRPLEVGEPFGLGRARRYPLARFAADLGAELVEDAVASVRPDAHRLGLASGAGLDYDVLLLALGARAVPAYEHGIVFDRPSAPEAFDELLTDLRGDFVRRIAFVVPPGVRWTLPAYELALLTAAHGRAASPDLEVTLVTHEATPLAVFGPAVAAEVEAIAGARGVRLLTGATAFVWSDTVLTTSAGGPWVAADRIVSLPLPAGRAITGLPADEHGFLPVDAHGRLDGVEDVYAVGDGTDLPIKQGGLTAQQADAAARHIAWRAGAPVRPAPFAPVLRGVLRTADGPRYLRADLGERYGAGEAAISTEPLWWPPAKIASRWLAPYLANLDLEALRAA